MKAYELVPGSGIDGLKLVERAQPSVGPRDVRVRIRAVSLNYRDLLVARTGRGDRAIVPTSDGAGEVIAIGSDVRELAIGDRVVASFFPHWPDGPRTAETDMRVLGGDLDGMLAEEVVLPATSWVRIARHLTFEQAATLPCAGVTAYKTLFEVVPLRPGGTVLVQGTGGVSIFALQLARAAGATVIATSSSPAKAERARSLGAATVIDYQTNPAWGTAAYQAAGSGVDLVVEVGGPGTFEQSAAATRLDGAIGIVGVLTGERGQLDLSPVRRKGIHVFGVYIGPTRMLAALNRTVERWSLQPIVDRTFAFDEARQALTYLASGAQLGKVVIRI